MISLFFLLLITWYIREERKLPPYLQDLGSSDPFMVAAVVVMYIILFSLMFMEILFYFSMVGITLLTMFGS